MAAESRTRGIQRRRRGLSSVMECRESRRELTAGRASSDESLFVVPAVRLPPPLARTMREC